MGQKEHESLKCNLWKRTDSKQSVIVLFYTFVLLAIFFAGKVNDF